MPQRYFYPDLAKIESLRIKQGWTVDDLARNAGISRRTLDRLNGKKGVVMSTVRCIAEAFGMEPDDLLPGNADGAAKSKRQPRYDMEFRLELPFESITGTIVEAFKELVAAKLQSTDATIVISVQRGCTIITLNMSERDVIRLISLAMTAPDDISAGIPSFRTLLEAIRHVRASVCPRRGERTHIQLSSSDRQDFPEKLVSELVLAARAKTTKGGDVWLSFKVRSDAKLLQKQPGAAGDLRDYKMSKITLKMPSKSTKTSKQQGKGNRHRAT